MVSGTTTQIREILSPKDFRKKCVEHETFILHLLVEDQFNKKPTELQSYFLDPKEYEDVFHAPFKMKIWLDMIQLPYYELFMKNAVDIMVDLGYNTQWIFNQKENDFWMAFLIIHQGKVYFNSQNICYCIEAATESIIKLNPDFFVTD